MYLITIFLFLQNEIVSYFAVDVDSTFSTLLGKHMIYLTHLASYIVVVIMLFIYIYLKCAFSTVNVVISLFASKEKYSENEDVVNVTIRLDTELPDGVDKIPINYTTADGTASKPYKL